MIDDDKTESHPSYGVIQISRVSGHATLFESVARHQHFISLSIHTADRNRSLARDWTYPRKELIEVWMSEVQFAQAITSLNMGSGSPCTLHRVDGSTIPPPEVDAMRERFDKDIKEETSAIGERLLQLEKYIDNLIAQGKAGKKDLGELKALVRREHIHLTDTIPFIEKQFEEATENVLAKAKCEFEAHVSAAAQRIGMKAIADSAPRPLMLEKGESDDTHHGDRK